MEIHFVRNADDTTAACGRSLLAEEPDESSRWFSTRHDQATCPGCKAANPF